MIVLDPSLLDSAPLARRLAPELCRHDPDTGASCAWIHGFWQYMRLLGLASTPALHAGFFARALETCMAGSQAPRLLISGAADYAMLGVVLQACRQMRVTPELTVVDRCETPLMLNRWFAQREAIRITTVHSDIFDFTDRGGFDAICTHSFLSEIPAQRWPGLLVKWRQLLRGRGAAVTVNRVRPGRDAGAVYFTPQEAAAFRAAVLAKAKSLDVAWRGDPLDLAREVETYMSRRHTYALPSQEAAVALFEGAGFRIESLTCGPVASGVPEAISGPTTPGKAEYARIVARKA